MRPLLDDALPPRPPLTPSSQTSPDALPHPPHACDRRPHRCLRPLLQALPPLHPNPRLCDTPRHRPRAHPDAGPLLVDAPRLHHDPRHLAHRSLVRLLPGRRRVLRPPPPPPAAHVGRDWPLLFAHPAAQVLAAPSATTLALLPAPERPHNHRLQLWSYAGRNYMAHPARPRIDCLCRRLEPGARKCLFRRGLVGGESQWRRRRRNRGY